MPDSPRAFVSYSRADSEFALRLTEDLKAAGANVWLDQLDIEPGTPWDSAIEDALLASGHLLVILSNVSVTSDNVRDEISYALGQQMKVIPVLYQDCKVPFRLARLQHIDFRNDYPTALKYLLRTLRIAQQAPPAPAEQNLEARKQEEARQQAQREEELAQQRREEERLQREQAEAARKAEEARLQAEREEELARQRREEERRQRTRAEAARKAAELPKNDPTRIALEAIQEALTRPEAQEASQQAQREEQQAEKRREEERRQREQAEAARAAEEARKAEDTRRAEAAKQTVASTTAIKSQTPISPPKPSIGRIALLAIGSGVARMLAATLISALMRQVSSSHHVWMNSIASAIIGGLIVCFVLLRLKPQLSGKVRPVFGAWILAGVALGLFSFVRLPSHAPATILVLTVPTALAGAYIGRYLARTLRPATSQGVVPGLVAIGLPVFLGQIAQYIAFSQSLPVASLGETLTFINLFVYITEIALLLWFIRNWGRPAQPTA